MENAFNVELAHYYRQLQLVEKSLATQASNFGHPSKNKSFLKTKISVISKGKLRQRFIESDKKQGRKTQSKQEIDQNRKSQQGLPLKYLADLNESQINNRGTNSSSLSKQQSQRIVFQICQPSTNKNITVLDNTQIVNTAFQVYHRQPLSKIQQEIPLTKHQVQELKHQQNPCETISAEATQQLIDRLALRNRIYEIFRKHLRVSAADYTKQWENIWDRCVLYKQFIQKVSKFSGSIIR